MVSRSIALFALILTFVAPDAFGSRAHRSMGDSIREAGLIAIADTAQAAAPLDTVLTLREVLKGDRKLRGRRITLRTVRASSADVYVPRPATGLAVLLAADWEKGERPVIEVYAQPEAIAALHVLVPVYERRAERDRLVALRDAALAHSGIVRDQFFNDAREMRDPANFPLLTELFPSLDEKGQRAAIGVLELIGDGRGVATLIEAMRSPREWVAIEAASALRFHFPGAPGVTEAFRNVRGERLKESAVQYLARYDPALRATIAPNRNSYQRAVELIGRGDDAGARALLPAILKDPKQVEPLVRFNAAWLSGALAADPALARGAAPVLMPVLQTYAKTGDYLQAIAAAEVLRSLREAAAVEPLHELLRKEDDALFAGSIRIAAYALLERGGVARSIALERLRTREDWAALQPIVEAAGRPDEASLLVRRLTAAEPAFYASITAGWLYYRLGRLRDESAAPALAKALQDPYWDTSAVVEALKYIGGPKTEAVVLPLLRAADPGTRQAAMEVLLDVQGRRFLPLLRRMLSDPAIGLRGTAAMYIGRIGDPSDLALLLPLADFWRGDRENHYWMMQAVAELRDRHGYDVNGKIRGGVHGM